MNGPLEREVVTQTPKIDIKVNLDILRETRLNGRRFINFFYLFEPEGQEERIRFIQAVEASKGSTRLVIHPYCRYDVFDFEDTIEGREKFIRANEKAILTHGSPGRTPIILFEEAYKIQDTLEKVSAAAPTGSIFYVIPTDIGYPAPKLCKDIEKVEKTEESLARWDEAWDYLSNKFREVGIKKAMVGGRKFALSAVEIGEDGEYNFYKPFKLYGSRIYDVPISDLRSRRTKDYQEWLDYNRGRNGSNLHKTLPPLPKRCVGTTMVELGKRGFEVTLSRFSNPYNTWATYNYP